MNSGEQRPIFQNTSGSYEFAHPARIHAAQFGTNRKNRFRFPGKIKCILRLVETYALQAKTIVEERRSAAFAIRNDAVEPAIQILEKVGILFVAVDQIRRSIECAIVPTRFEITSGIRRRIVFSS